MRRNAISKLVAITASIAFIVWIQIMPWLSIFGVKPNIFLVGFVFIALFLNSLLLYTIFLIFGAALLYNVFFFSWPTLVLIALIFAVFFLIRKLPWRTFVTITAIVTTGTIAFYSIVNPLFVLVEYRVIVLEALYNILLAAVVYALIQRFSTVR